VLVEYLGQQSLLLVEALLTQARHRSSH